MKYVTKSMIFHQHGAWLLLKKASHKVPKVTNGFWQPNSSIRVTQAKILMQYSERAHKK